MIHPITPNSSNTQKHAHLHPLPAFNGTLMGVEKGCAPGQPSAQIKFGSKLVARVFRSILVPKHADFSGSCRFVRLSKPLPSASCDFLHSMAWKRSSGSIPTGSTKSSTLSSYILAASKLRDLHWPESKMCVEWRLFSRARK